MRKGNKKEKKNFKYIIYPLLIVIFVMLLFWGISSLTEDRFEKDSPIKDNPIHIAKIVRSNLCQII